MKNDGVRIFLLLVGVLALSGCTRACSSAIGYPPGDGSPLSSVAGDPNLNVDKDFQFPDGFPPDPGPAGKKTLVGIDADGDGLRDDVQRWIYARFPKDVRKRKALRQSAIYYQSGMAREVNATNYLEASEQGSRAISCILFTFSYEIQAHIEMEYVAAKVLNTHERTKRYLDNDRAYDGKVFDLKNWKLEEACD